MLSLPPLTTLVLIAAGGYFAGGVLTGLAEGSGIRRMFSGSPREQAVQLLVALAAVWLAVRSVGISVPGVA